jgi:hypothetical protein
MRDATLSYPAGPYFYPGAMNLTNPFASYPAGAILDGMDDVEVVQGSCLHGHAIQTLGNAVHFVESCPICAAQLAAEGFSITSSRALHSAA